MILLNLKLQAQSLYYRWPRGQGRRMVSAQDLELALLSTSLPSFHVFFLTGDIDDNGDIDHADDKYDGEDGDDDGDGIDDDGDAGGGDDCFVVDTSFFLPSLHPL